MHPEIIYYLALTQLPQIGHKQARILLQHFESPAQIFKANKRSLEALDGMGPLRASSILEFSDFERCEAECRFLEKQQATAITLHDSQYPTRLLECPDAPIVLFSRGNVNLNPAKTIGIIGTRQPTAYGQQLTCQLIQELAVTGATIVSGLALGIDTIAHRKALESHLPTWGVLGHGLDRIYPAQNRGLAQDMEENGGLLTEFFTGNKPDRTHFPRRNRIVAGLCDALVVIETGDQGGSMITASFAAGYNRDVFAYPGRVTDERSHGNHQLIRHHLAELIENGHDVLTAMNWLPKAPAAGVKQPALFPDLSADATTVLSLLPRDQPIHIDHLFRLAGLNSSQLAASLLELEMQAQVTPLPGKFYQRL